LSGALIETMNRGTEPSLAPSSCNHTESVDPMPEPTHIPEVIIPLIGSFEELENRKVIVKAVAEEVLGKAGLKE
jgi:hypothetical protein